jgi:hypothetical protein
VIVPDLTSIPAALGCSCDHALERHGIALVQHACSKIGFRDVEASWYRLPPGKGKT